MTDTHEKIIKAFLEYTKWQERFEYRGSDEAGIKARNALLIIGKLTKPRRLEIQIERKRRRQIRNGKPGPPTQITKNEGY
jgi:hypothetical protein